jgi:hypothetical protein
LTASGCATGNHRFTFWLFGVQGGGEERERGGEGKRKGVPLTASGCATANHRFTLLLIKGVPMAEPLCSTCNEDTERSTVCVGISVFSVETQYTI